MGAAALAVAVAAAIDRCVNSLKRGDKVRVIINVEKEEAGQGGNSSEEEVVAD